MKCGRMEKVGVEISLEKWHLTYIIKPGKKVGSKHTPCLTCFVIGTVVPKHRGEATEASPDVALTWRPSEFKHPSF